MNLIACVDNNWAIGNKGRLLVSIPGDHKMFRETTTGKVVVYGRKTLETFPGGLPLKNRVNIILSGNRNFSAGDAMIVHSREELLECLKNFRNEDIYIIGGESIYSLMAEYCDKAMITKVNYSYEADAYFPDLSRLKDWELKDESEEMTCYDIEYTFQTWVKNTGL